MSRVNEKAGPAGTGTGAQKSFDAPTNYHDRLIDASDFDVVLFNRVEDNMTDSKYLITGLLPEAPLSLLVGNSQTGKTGLALEMAGCISSGYPFLGLEVSPTPVIYLTAEGGRAQFNGRVLALRRRFEADRRGLLRAAFVHSWFDLVGNFGKVVKAATDCAVALKREFGDWPGLLIIDTLGSMSLGVTETTAEGMGEILDALGRLHHKLGVSVFVLHHPAMSQKGEVRRMPRGHGSLFQRADCSLFTDGRTLSIVKQRDGATDLTLGYARRTVYLANATSYVIDRTDSEPAKPAGASNDAKVYAELCANPDYKSIPALAERVGISQTALKIALRRLVESGMVRKVGSATKARYEPLQRVSASKAA